MRADRILRLALLLAVLPAAPARANVYCCDNENGRQVCADVLPQQCYGRAYRIMNSQGMVVKEVAAPLTLDEIRAKREREREQRVEANRVRAQKLRERALLETYQDLDDIDRQELRAIAEVEADIARVRASEENLLKERARLGREQEFYQGKALPPELNKKLRENEEEILSLRSVVEAKQKHIEAIRDRYAEDRRAYHEILDRRDAVRRR